MRVWPLIITTVLAGCLLASCSSSPRRSPSSDNYIVSPNSSSQISELKNYIRSLENQLAVARREADENFGKFNNMRVSYNLEVKANRRLKSRIRTLENRIGLVQDQEIVIPSESGSGSKLIIRKK